MYENTDVMLIPVQQLLPMVVCLQKLQELVYVVYTQSVV